MCFGSFIVYNHTSKTMGLWNVYLTRNIGINFNYFGSGNFIGYSGI